MKARPRRLRGLLALTGALTTGLLMLGVRPASAVVTCLGIDPLAPVHVHVLMGGGDAVTISVGTGVNLGRILVNGLPCSTATVNNIDFIEVVGDPVGAETVTLDLSNGPLAPGLTDEPGTTDEIEIDVTPLLGGPDELRILGTSGADTIVFGDDPGPDLLVGIGVSATDSINLNGDEDADVGVDPDLEILHVDGGPGDDVLSGNGGSGTGAAIPTPLVLHGQEGNDDLFGGTGGDELGQAGNLEPGDDRITGGAGDDTLNGGDPSASDTLDYSRETGTAGVAVDLGTPSATDTFGDSDTLGAEATNDNSFEDVLGSPNGDVVRGDIGSNTIEGREGDDNLAGTFANGDDVPDGNDTILGEAGDDFLRGQSGDDMLDGGEGNDFGGGGPGNDTFLGGPGNDDFVFGGPGNDVIDGGTGNDAMGGGDGNDTLTDGDGDDSVSGDAGADVWFVGLGTDSADGGSGFDTANAAGIPNGVEANLNLGFINGASSDAFTAFEAFWGTPLNDTITGGGGSTTVGVVIKGRKGDDTVTGTDGVDLILGGQGDDSLTGLGGGDTLRGNDGDDVLRDAEGDDLVAGGGGNDSLRGGSGDDIIRGNGGNDNLKGGSGDDILNGGTGTDTCNDGSGDNAFRSCER